MVWAKHMRRARIVAIVAVVLIAMGFLATSLPPSVASAGGNQGRRFGFWVSGDNIGPPFYSPAQFANAMFLTPPYPSSAELMMFGAQQDIAAGYAVPGSGPSIKNDISNLDGMASVMDAYPNVQINVMVALGDLSQPTALAYFKYYLNNLASHPSLYSFGLEGEYSSNVNVGDETPLMQAAQAAGKQYFDYYKDSGIAPEIAHFNCPQNQNPDECGLLLSDTGSGYVGMSAGYDAKFPFPGTCPVPTNLNVPGQNNCGWTQGYVSLILSLFVQPPSSTRQIDHFTAGASSSGSFVGVSGQTTNQMWDNPTLRNWIWNDPNYQGNYVLSTSSVSTTSSGTASTATTGTSQSTSHTTRSTASSTISTSTRSTTSRTTSSGGTSSASTHTSTTADTSSTAAISSQSTTNYPPPGGSYSLDIVSACPALGMGSYSAGDSVEVQAFGVCNRKAGSGLRISSWSLDGGASHPVESSGTASIVVRMNSSHIIQFLSLTQYQLVLDYGAALAVSHITASSIPGDNYWYDSGTQVTYMGNTSSGSSYFVSWSLDSSPGVPIGTGRLFATYNILMDAPHTLYVTIASRSITCKQGENCTPAPMGTILIQSKGAGAPGFTVDGTHYTVEVSLAFALGSKHTIVADGGTIVGPEKTSFESWTGSVDSRSDSISIVTSTSQVLIANYELQYLVQLVFTDSAGTEISPSAVQLSNSTGSFDLQGNSSVWLQSGLSYSVSRAIWEGVNVPGASTFSIDTAGQTKVSLLVFPQTITVKDPLGSPIQGALVVLKDGIGTDISAVTNSEGIASFDAPYGTFLVTASYMGYSAATSIYTVGAHDVELTVLLSQTVIAGIATAAAALGAVAFLMWRRYGKTVDLGSLTPFFSDE